MATFESMDRRMPKIEACLKANGLESLDACNEMLLAKGIDCRQDRPRCAAHLL